MVREPIDLVMLETKLREETAMDGTHTGDRPMAMTTQIPSGAPQTNGNSANGSATPAAPSGLPPEQLYTWLEWVQDDLRRVETRIEFLESARSQLREQERLLSELLRASGPLAAAPAS